MIVEGKIVEKYDTQNIKDTFKKREFVIEYAENPQYPEYIKFELIQSNCEQLDDLSTGDQVSVNFNLKGRKWTDPQVRQNTSTAFKRGELIKNLLMMKELLHLLQKNGRRRIFHKMMIYPSNVFS
ncbi:MAG: DUF3127 domain-containing protein [Bacteroidota bacterium]